MKIALGFLLFLMISCGGSYVPKGKIVEVKQGDQVLVPYTFIDPHSQPRQFQLLGIVSPDPQAGEAQLREAYYGVLAKNYTQKWAEDRTVTLERPLRKENNLVDRSRGWVKDPETGEYLHQALLAEGLARADLQGHDLGRQGQKIRALENQARQQQKGMWSLAPPPEHEMRQVVKAAAGPLGQLVQIISQPKQKEVPQVVAPSKETNVAPKEPLPLQEPISVVPRLPSSQASQSNNQVPELVQQSLGSGHQLLLAINAEAEEARREFLNWQALPGPQKQSQGALVRQKLRSVKIHVMDALDETEALSEGQKTFLKSLREDMNRLMTLIPR